MTNESKERGAVVMVSPEAFTQILQLPVGSYIDGIVSDDAVGALRLRIRGAGWPVELGKPLQQATPVVRRSFDDQGRELRPQIDWGFPK